MALKLYTGHPCHCLQFFEKRSILYIGTETFNVSIYGPYHTMQFSNVMNLPGKKVQVMRQRNVQGDVLQPSWKN